MITTTFPKKRAVKRQWAKEGILVGYFLKRKGQPNVMRVMWQKTPDEEQMTVSQKMP